MSGNECLTSLIYSLIKSGFYVKCNPLDGNIFNLWDTNAPQAAKSSEKGGTYVTRWLSRYASPTAFGLVLRVSHRSDSILLLQPVPPPPCPPQSNGRGCSRAREALEQVWAGL